MDTARNPTPARSPTPAPNMAREPAAKRERPTTTPDADVSSAGSSRTPKRQRKSSSRTLKDQLTPDRWAEFLELLRAANVDSPLVTVGGVDAEGESDDDEGGSADEVKGGESLPLPDDATLRDHRLAASLLMWTQVRGISRAQLLGSVDAIKKWSTATNAHRLFQRNGNMSKSLTPTVAVVLEALGLDGPLARCVLRTLLLRMRASPAGDTLIWVKTGDDATLAFDALCAVASELQSIRACERKVFLRRVADLCFAHEMVRVDNLGSIIWRGSQALIDIVWANTTSKRDKAFVAQLVAIYTPRAVTMEMSEHIPQGKAGNMIAYEMRMCTRDTITDAARCLYLFRAAAVTENGWATDTNDYHYRALCECAVSRAMRSSPVGALRQMVTVLARMINRVRDTPADASPDARTVEALLSCSTFIHQVWRTMVRRDLTNAEFGAMLCVIEPVFQQLVGEADDEAARNDAPMPRMNVTDTMPPSVKRVAAMIVSMPSGEQQTQWATWFCDNARRRYSGREGALEVTRCMCVSSIMVDAQTLVYFLHLFDAVELESKDALKACVLDYVRGRHRLSPTAIRDTLHDYVWSPRRGNTAEESLRLSKVTQQLFGVHIEYWGADMHAGVMPCLLRIPPRMLDAYLTRRGVADEGAAAARIQASLVSAGRWVYHTSRKGLIIPQDVFAPLDKIMNLPVGEERVHEIRYGAAMEFAAEFSDIYDTKVMGQIVTYVGIPLCGEKRAQILAAVLKNVREWQGLMAGLTVTQKPDESLEVGRR